MPKYVRMGVGWPGVAGADWKRAIVSGVRSTCAVGIGGGSVCVVSGQIWT